MELFSPAKINLFLHVTGKRSDGYHDLHMLMCGIGIFDRIILRPGVGKFSLTCSQPGIPEDESNLAMRAALLFTEKLGVNEGVSITLEKKIPAGAGLGGGSSNAATVLTGLNTYYGFPYSGAELLEMGRSLGADVPFFIYGRPAIAEGIGERLRFCENIKPYTVIVIYPGISLSTAKVYKKLNFGLTKREKKIKSRLLNKRLVDPIQYLENDLEKPASLLCIEINELRGLLLEHRAEGVLMSGSGSSVFGLYSELDKAKKAFTDLLNYKEDHKDKCEKWQLFLADMVL